MGNEYNRLKQNLREQTPQAFPDRPSFTPPEGTPPQVGAQSAVEMAEESAKEEGQEEYRAAELAEQQRLDAARREQERKRKEAADAQRMVEAGIGLGEEGERRFDTSVLDPGASSVPALTPLAEEAMRYLNANLTRSLAEGTPDKFLGTRLDQEGWQAITDRALMASMIPVAGQAIKAGTPLFTKLFTSPARPKTVSEAAAVLPKAQLEDAVSLPGQYLIHGIRPKKGQHLPPESYIEHGLLIKINPETGRKRTTYHTMNNWGMSTETMSAAKRADGIINPVAGLSGKPVTGASLYPRVLVMRGDPFVTNQPFKGSTVPGFKGGSSRKWIPDYTERIPPENIMGVWDRSTGQFTIGRAHPDYIPK